jgi:hypothetical protein
MSQLGQKASVIKEVLTALPTFQLGIDNALSALAPVQLEAIKSSIQRQIMAGVIEYSKDIYNVAEVRSYARSMVMNHLKKAKELNGGKGITSNTSGSGGSPASVPRVTKETTKGIKLDLLPEDLKYYATQLLRLRSR